MNHAPSLGGARIGLGAAYGLGARGVLRAFDAGVRFFLWGALPKADFGAGLRTLARAHRAELRIAVQSYARRGLFLRPGVELALKRLGTDYIDWLCLADWDHPPPSDVVDAALALKANGKIRHLMISCHHRPSFAALQSQPHYKAWMVRYNAAHRRAEHEVFPLAQTGSLAPGLVAYTALRWGTLLDPRYAPPGEPPLSAEEAYRFVLSHPAVTLCLAGPRDDAELDAALDALRRGPLDDEALARAQRIGDAAYTFGKAQPPPRPRDLVREAPAMLRDLVRHGVTEHLLSRFNR